MTVYASASASPVIGVATTLAACPVRAGVTADPVLGVAAAAAGVGPVRASASAAGVLAASAGGHATYVCRGSATIPAILGRAYAAAAVTADAWSSARFAPPKIEGYTHTWDAGLTRTKFYSGRTRQRQRWDDGRRTISVKVDVTVEALGAMEQFINDRGYDWFTMGLVTGDNLSDGLRIHVVRIKGNPQLGNIYGDTIEVSLELESL